MIEKLLAENPSVKDKAKAKEIVTAYVNKTCVEILKNTAVFKNDAVGVAAMTRFLQTVDVK